MDPTQQTINLFITYVDKEGPFLKVWGQAEKNNSIYVEQFLLGASQQFDQGIGKIPFETLQVGTLVCTKYKDDKYYRARIVKIDYLNQCFVEVSFLDFGNKDIVPSENIRSLQNFPTSFISIPPLATGFIFAEAHCPGGGEWKDQVFEIISKELRYREVQCHLLTQATQYYLIKLYINNTDIGALFISRGLMQPIPLHAQQAVLLSMSMEKKSQVIPAAPVGPPTEINTYKACTLEPKQQYAVYVSFVNEGPTHFSVQLQQSEHMLAKLMKDINEINLRLLEDVPLPGTICLARCQEDGNICRAVVTNEVDNQFKVFFVDFGNYETLPLECLYQIPFKYVLPKVMAIRLALNGVEKSTVTMEMLLAFKKFVDNRLLHMTVLPSPRKSVITKCELWDPETKTSALDVINRAAQHAYPEPLPLNRGFTQPVKVSYVFSCNRFYVQLSSKELELSKVMEDLQVSCQSSDPIYDVKIGLPCCALFEGDQLWYRSEVVDVVDKDNVKVRYIDYGNEEVVPINLLRMVEGELLTVLRPQAIECCLNGYQNMGVDETRDAFLEELILEQNFTMKVSEMLGKKALVELIDANNYNVASLLLDKLASAKSQVSPMLVQAGNTLEHRKFSDSSDNYRPQRKPARDWSRTEKNDTSNFSKSNDKSWRHESNNDTRSNDINSNDGSSDSGSWRQTNKGFNRNEKNDRDRDRGERFQREDKHSVNERFNRNRGHDNKNNNWNSKENGSQNISSWDSPGNAAASAASDSWQDEAPPPVQNNFEGRKPRDDKFGGGKKRFDNRGDRRDDQGGWHNNKDGFKKDGFKKDFRKDGSECSSESEKSFRKGPRTSSRNDHGGAGGKRFQNRSTNSFADASVNDSWSVSDVSTPIDAAPSSAKYDLADVVGSEAAVVISWFHNPDHFYCQLQSGQPEFKTLMEEIQQFYKNRKPETCVVGAPVIGLFPEDNVLYRAQVLEVAGGQYKVFYVDFGNVSTISKVWPIEKKFMQMPAQAVCSGLSSIGPNGDKWPDSSCFSQYFNKEFYMARFLDKDENKTYVQLWDNQDDVSQLLVQASLAVYVAPQDSNGIEIALLLNQQFRVVLKSVNNLNDIIVALECGLALTCKAHNSEMAAETYDEVLKSYLEQTLIMYVDNILENDILDATFYDNEGNKLAILTPDEGALDNVDPLCPMLITSSHINGYVSHANENSIFIQPSIYTDQLNSLLEQMYASYEKITEEASIVPEEGFIYAVHSADGNWYRGRVENFDDDKATVFYVDYGNTESVTFSELRDLKSEFNVPNIMCLQVTVVSGLAQSFLEKEVVAAIYYGETGWEGTVQEYEQSAEVGELADPPESATISVEGNASIQESTLLQEPVQTDSTTTTLNQTNAATETSVDADQDVALVTESLQKGTPIYVSHVDSPSEFYVQFAQSLTALKELQEKLQEAAEEMPVLENISAGVLCAAPYSVDHQWYRAEVLDADEDITTVRFVDYGNTDVINNKTTQVRTLPSDLLTLAVYATRCSLKLRAIEEEWSQQAMELFETLANRENVTAEFIIQDEKTNIVELYADGDSIKDALLAQNLAVPCEIVTESKTTCFVSHLNSPSEFWVQMENCVDELEWIAEQLSRAAQFPELEDLAPGTLCAALFPDDEGWYRARILSNTVAGIELLFVDYGNSCVSSSLRQLPEDLIVTPPLAQKCCLQRPEGIPYWTKEAQDKFAEISAEGQTTFEIKKISTGETATVELLFNGENIVSRILPVTQDGILKDFETLDKFYVEINGEMLPESVCLEPMPGMMWDEGSTKKFLELYPEGSVFQVEVIAEDCVRLYKNAADIRPQLGGVKTNLNLSNSQDKKTDNVDISEDSVIDYEAGGDNLDTKHSIEDDIQDDSGASQCESEATDAVSNKKDSAEVDSGTDLVTEKNSIPELETDCQCGSVATDMVNKNEGFAGVNSSIDFEKDITDCQEGSGASDAVSNKEDSAEVNSSIDLEKDIIDCQGRLGATDAVSSKEDSAEVDSSIDLEKDITDCQEGLGASDAVSNKEDSAEVNSSIDLEKDIIDCQGRLGATDAVSSKEDSAEVDSSIDLEKDITDCQEGLGATDAVSNKEDSAEVNSSIDLVQKATDGISDNEDSTQVHSNIDLVNDKTSSPELETDSGHHSDNHDISTKDHEKENLEAKITAANCEENKANSEKGKSEIQPRQSKTGSKSSSIDRATIDQSYDDMILPDSVSRFHSRIIRECEENHFSRPSRLQGLRVSHDDKILPASVSRPHSPLISDNEEGSLSRPSSSQGHRISHDDKILPAVISRPHSPLLDYSD